jgi:outer membrane protein W
MRSVKLLVVAAAALAMVLPAAAQERNVKIGVYYSQVEMQGDEGLGDGFSTDFDQGNGYGASASFFFGRFFAAEAAVFNLRTDTGLVFDETATFDLGTMRLTTISAGPQLHILGQSRFDPYVGAGVAYVMGDDLLSPDLEALGVGRVELDNAVTYYINAGLAVEILSGLGLVVDARQFQYEPSTRSLVTGVEQDLDVTPRVLSAGLRLRF